MTTPSSPVTRVLAQSRMELRLLLRSGESLLVTFGIPLGLLVLFGTTDLLPTDAGEEPLDFLVPGVLAIAVLSTGFVAQAIQTAFERKYGVLKRLGASPLTRPQYLLGKGLAVAAVVTVQVAVLVAVAVALGWRPGGSTGGTEVVGADDAAASAVLRAVDTDWSALAAVVPPVVVGAAVFTALGLALAGAVRAELVLAGSNAVYLVLLAGTDLVFDLPAAATPIVLFTPSGALGILLRDALTGDLGVQPWIAWLVLLAWGGVALLVAGRTFRWEP